jgi:predicted lipid-binding transport protein (Tim44 family)
MQPVPQGVTALDLQKIRQQNENSLQVRATQQLGAQLKTAANESVSEEEKLTAGQGDQVDIEAKTKISRSSSSSSSARSQSSSAKTPQESTSSEEPAPEPPSQEPPSEPPVETPKIEYSDAQKAFLSRLEELEKQNKTLRDMWRKMYMDWLDDQLKAREDMENFRQSTMLMWNEVATSRWIQGTRHAEAVRGLL